MGGTGPQETKFHSQMIDIDSFFSRQLSQWPMAADNFAALGNVLIREVEGADGFKVQFNPARIVSTGANVSKEAIKVRKCFLCEANRPPEQIGLDWGDYVILVNPFPIFPGHLTIPAKTHTPQLISGRAADMLRLAADLPGYTVFYNGARCGASAPDHIHFQAVPSDRLPLWGTVKENGLTTVIGGQKAFVIKYTDIDAAAKQLQSYLAYLPVDADSGEPMVNVLCRESSLVVIPRRRHRPSDYGSGDGRILLSPASIDLSGVLITPLRRDFDSIDAETVRRVLSEVSFT